MNLGKDVQNDTLEEHGGLKGGTREHPFANGHFGTPHGMVSVTKTSLQVHINCGQRYRNYQ